MAHSSAQRDRRRIGSDRPDPCEAEILAGTVSGRVARRLAALLALLSAVAAPLGAIRAAEGDVLLYEDFESGLGAWTTTDSNLSGTNSMTYSSASNSLFLRGDTVTTTSPVIDTRVPAIRVRAWIRRGADSFSEDTDDGEDLEIEYRADDGSWLPLASYDGNGTKGEVIDLDLSLAGGALHDGFQLRFHLTSGNGGPPANGGIGYDYWHVDDVRVTEEAAPEGLALGSCEEFEQGLGAWSVLTGSGRASVTSQTWNTASNSLAINGGRVEVRSLPIDLSLARNLELSLWIRRGASSFSEDPDKNEDLYVEYLDDRGRWQTLERFPGDASTSGRDNRGRRSGRDRNGAGEIFTPTYGLPADASHADFQLRLRMQHGSGPEYDFWHVDSVCLTGETVVGEWRFEEPSWNGTPSEVLDDSSFGHDGRAIGSAEPLYDTPAIPGDPGTCAQADLDGTSAAIEIPHADELNGTDGLTYTAWIRPRSWSGGIRQVMAKSVHGGGSGRAQMGIFSEGGVLKGRAETRAGRVEVSAPLPALDDWTHVALTFDAGTLRLYTNGALADSTSLGSTSLNTTTDPLAIGKRVGSDQYYFDGSIDEVRVYRSALSASSVVEVMGETHPCTRPGVVFRIEHDGAGARCEPEPIRVTATDLTGAPLTTYTGTITLDTQTGTGSWSLVDGAGAFSDAVADDGLATYVFSSADAGTARFGLSYSTGPSAIDVDVSDGSASDDDSEGLLYFAPSAFLITANTVPDPPPATIDDPIGPQTAGLSFSLHVTAYGNDSGADCSVVESYEGDHDLQLWTEYVDPASPVLVPTVNGQAIGANQSDATTQTIVFERGRAVLEAKYKDAGRVAIRMLDAVTTPDGIPGGTGHFVSKPADLAIVAVEDASANANPEGTSPSDPLFVRAGLPFTVRVDALDAEGSRTPNFGHESIAEGIRLRSATLLAPAGGRNGSADDGTLDHASDFTAISPQGRFEGTAFAFDEVGAIRLRANIADGDYLGSGDVDGSPSVPVGRFAPASFDVSVNSPRLETGCDLGAFTWLGQPFGYAPGEEPVLTVTAQNASGGTTANYRDDWWRITNDSLQNRSLTANGSVVDESGLPDPGVDPTIVANGDGTGTLTFSSGSGIALERDAPVAPFDAEIQLSVDVLDLDGTVYPANPATIGGTSAGEGIAFDVSKRFQFGRLRFDNAHGSELATLPMRLHTQSFDGERFVDDGADSCSHIPVAALQLTPSPAGLSVTPTIGNDPLLAGDADLRLSPPASDGTVDLLVDLGPSGADLPWLRFDWPEDGNLDGVYDDDPRARATFGIWEGREQLIYLRERY